jgi:hypothetical protein
METRHEHASALVQQTFGDLAEELFAIFCEELQVAESIDMFHIGPDDWDPVDVAVFTASYVAFACRYWLFAAAADGEAVERAVYSEAERFTEKMIGSGTQTSAGRRGWADRVDRLLQEWRSLRLSGSAEWPFSRAPEAIFFLCRHLLKPESRGKAENLALMPFLQIYIPERFSDKRLAAKRVAAVAEPKAINSQTAGPA